MKAPSDIYFGEYGSLGLTQKNIGYKATGEFRPPRKGEHYLSGNPINAWLAPNDLSEAFWIAIPGTVTTIVTKTWAKL